MSSCIVNEITSEILFGSTARSQTKLFSLNPNCFKIPNVVTPILLSRLFSWGIAENETGRAIITNIANTRLDVEIEAPLMLRKKKFQVRIVIQNIKKRRPSLCDEVEL